jgi:hypothetical protein
MKRGLDVGRKENVQPIKKMVGPLAPLHNRAVHVYGTEYMVLLAIVCLAIGYLAGRVVTAFPLDEMVVKWHII